MKIIIILYILLKCNGFVNCSNIYEVNIDSIDIKNIYTYTKYLKKLLKDDIISNSIERCFKDSINQISIQINKIKNEPLVLNDLLLKRAEYLTNLGLNTLACEDIDRILINDSLNIKLLLFKIRNLIFENKQDCKNYIEKALQIDSNNLETIEYLCYYKFNYELNDTDNLDRYLNMFSENDSLHHFAFATKLSYLIKNINVNNPDTNKLKDLFDFSFIYFNNYSQYRFINILIMFDFVNYLKVTSNIKNNFVNEYIHSIIKKFNLNSEKEINDLDLLEYENLLIKICNFYMIQKDVNMVSEYYKKIVHIRNKLNLGFLKSKSHMKGDKIDQEFEIKLYLIKNGFNIE